MQSLYKPCPKVQKIHATFLSATDQPRDPARNIRHSIALLEHHMPMLVGRDRTRAKSTLAELQRQLRAIKP